jgi:hypothetical protein
MDCTSRIEKWKAQKENILKISGARPWISGALGD